MRGNGKARLNCRALHLSMRFSVYHSSIPQMRLKASPPNGGLFAIYFLALDATRAALHSAPLYYNRVSSPSKSPHQICEAQNQGE